MINDNGIAWNQSAAAHAARAVTISDSSSIGSPSRKADRPALTPCVGASPGSWAFETTRRPPSGRCPPICRPA